jgi:hypothetical protein
MLLRPHLLVFISTVIAACCFSTSMGNAYAHGSVTPDADLCIIEIGYYRAHFKIYQPDTRQHKDYCEDLPDTGRSIFVMEYEHEGLGEVPIDFRIIENVTGNGFFANMEDIEKIEDLDSVTILHHVDAIQRDVFTVDYEFEESGNYIGVVTVQNPDTGKTYNAVFPFEVGYIGLGYWPWIAGSALLLHLNYLWMGGWFTRFAANRRSAQATTESVDA